MPGFVSPEITIAGLPLVKSLFYPDYNGLGEDFVFLAMRRSSINFEASCHGIEIY
jgi:hypothetical protein